MADSKPTGAATPVQPQATAAAPEATPLPTQPQEPAPAATVPTVAPAPAEETVVVSKEAFDGLMTRLGRMEEEQRLRDQVMDRNDAAKIEELRRAGKIVKNVRIHIYDNLPVLGWKMLKNDVYMREGRLVEDQTVEIITEDATKHVMNLRDWASLPGTLEGEVTKESKEQNGDVYFTVQFPDGKTIEINSVYVN